MEGQISIFDYLEESQKIYSLDIRGLCDDPYCPKCDYAFITYGSQKEIDCDCCPKCGIKVDWTRWHRMNDEEELC